MNRFEYVEPGEWKPVKRELLEIIHALQNEVREDFTFQYRFVGSSKRNMITRNRMGNTGYDFDVNIEVNDPDEEYTPKEIRTILRKALDRVIHPDGRSPLGYDYTEDSTRVLTLKFKDRGQARILHSCDFCIVYECSDGRQQYIHYDKLYNAYTWQYQSQEFDGLSKRIEWLKGHGLWQEVRDLYLEKKNRNYDPNKHSRSIYAETVNEVFARNR